MQDIFIEFLPPWVETNLQPAFYDAESGTVLQQTARMYAKVNELVGSVNNMDKVIKEYVDYINHYFENLDVQEEIDNKLDEMAEGGELAEYIAQYANLPCVHAYATIANMASSENLVDGSYARAMSKTIAGTGDGFYYTIRTRVEADDPDGENLVAVGDSLVAEKIPDANLIALELALDATIAKTQFVYETLGDMIADTEIGEGYTCKTLGKETLNDGYGATYTIGETGDIALDNGLYATVQNNYGNNYYNEITISSGRSDDTDYYVATIPLNDADGNLIVPYVNDETDTHTRGPLQYAQDEFTTLTMNAGLGYQDSHGTWQQGTVISNGVITHVYEGDTELNPDRCSYIGFKADRTIKNYSCTTTGETMLADGVVNAFLCFGQVIVNGVIPLDPEEWGEEAGYHPLEYIGVKADGTMLILSCDGRTNHDKGFTVYSGASKMADLGCINAWRIDGGGSSSMVYKGSKQNRNIDDNATKDRGIWVTLNFKKPTIDKQLAETYSFIGKERQLLNKQIRDDITAYNASYNVWNMGYEVNNLDAEGNLKVAEFPNAYRHGIGIRGFDNEGGTRIAGFVVNTVGLVKVTVTATYRNASQTVNTRVARTVRVVNYGTETLPNTSCMIYNEFTPANVHEYSQVCGTMVFNNATAGNKYSILLGGGAYDDFYRLNVQIEYIGTPA